MNLTDRPILEDMYYDYYSNLEKHNEESEVITKQLEVIENLLDKNNIVDRDSIIEEIVNLTSLHEKQGWVNGFQFLMQIVLECKANFGGEVIGDLKK